MLKGLLHRIETLLKPAQVRPAAAQRRDRRAGEARGEARKATTALPSKRSGSPKSVAPGRPGESVPGSVVRSPGTEQLLRLFEHSESGVLSCSREGDLLLCNPMAAQLFNAEPEQIIGTPIRIWLSPLAGGSARRSPSGFTVGQYETTAHREGGSTFPVELTVSEATLDGVHQLVLIVRDITDRKFTQERLNFLANYDSLTGLPNRTLFRDRLARAMARSRRSGMPMALMFLDLDRFKVVNDSLGHQVGDQLLLQVAKTLKACLRLADSVLQGHGEEAITVARLGGDEFTLIAEYVSGPDDAALVARRVLDAIQAPIPLGDTEVVISGSIGISMYPSDDTDLDGLIRHADMAMYRSKNLGKGVYSFYSDELSAQLAARLTLENDLRRALEQSQFMLHYQPKICLRTGAVTGVEALLRWNAPGRGTIAPDLFIAVLEDSDLMLPVGDWVLREACGQLAEWDRMGLPPMTMAVNLSARQFKQPRLDRLIADLLHECGLPPPRLELELTERVLMEDSEATLSIMKAFVDLGVKVAMDDFGTGHSSLSYLKRFRIDTLKIDRSFVDQLPQDAEDVAIATAIVAMGHSLGMRVVAEGVETVAQAEFLADLSCDQMQGFLISKPLPAPELVAWLRQRAAVGSVAAASPYAKTDLLAPVSLIMELP